MKNVKLLMSNALKKTELPERLVPQKTEPLTNNVSLTSALLP